MESCLNHLAGSARGPPVGPLLPLPQKAAEDREGVIGIGRVPHRQIQPEGGVEHRFGVAERLKPGFAMAGTHAAGPHATEGEAGGGEVEDSVIDTPAAELGPG